MENYFNELNIIDVSKKTEKKNALTYLSWAWAWGEVKKLHPDAQYKVYENADGWNYFTDGRTCWVKVSMTINDLEHIEYLPVMDNRNTSIPADKVTSFDVNKAIQRAITKACARHGLGLYIYAGEDLPEDVKTVEQRHMTVEQKEILQDYGADFDKLVKYYKHETIDQLTFDEAQEAIAKKQKAAKKAEEDAKMQAEAEKAFHKLDADEDGEVGDE
ncbi:MAG: DUF1071 domain-containing protein [Clostridiales bacterium]|nr:DUF1071 domain-containing protein [Clostridiales bacterium]